MEKLKIWYDPEGDLLEIKFSDQPGEYQATSSKNMMIKTDASGRMVGIMVLKVSEVEGGPMEIELSADTLKHILHLRRRAVST